jgi:hypothetical protein
MNPNSNSEIQVTLLPSQDGNQQSMMQKSSTEQRTFNEGDSRVRSVKSYRQVNSPPGGSLPRHAPTSLPRSRPRSLLRVDQDFTEVAYRERNHEVDRMVTDADFER